MSKSRRHFSPEEKVRMLKRHLVDGVSVSQVCDTEFIKPTQFYDWQKTFFENGAAAFTKDGKKVQARAAADRVLLEDRLRAKDHVIAVITEEHVALKKVLGEI